MVTAKLNASTGRVQPCRRTEDPRASEGLVEPDVAGDGACMSMRVAEVVELSSRISECALEATVLPATASLDGSWRAPSTSFSKKPRSVARWSASERTRGPFMRQGERRAEHYARRAANLLGRRAWARDRCNRPTRHSPGESAQLHRGVVDPARCSSEYPARCNTGDLHPSRSVSRGTRTSVNAAGAGGRVSCSAAKISFQQCPPASVRDRS